MIHSTFARAVHGRTLQGDVRIPDGPPPRSAVVVVHGFKGFKDWGFFPYLCQRMAAAGHAVVSFNLSGSKAASRTLPWVSAVATTYLSEKRPSAGVRGFS